MGKDGRKHMRCGGHVELYGRDKLTHMTRMATDAQTGVVAKWVRVQSTSTGVANADPRKIAGSLVRNSATSERPPQVDTTSSSRGMQRLETTSATRSAKSPRTGAGADRTRSSPNTTTVSRCRTWRSQIEDKRKGVGTPLRMGASKGS